jgi:hypothetical protein
MVMVRTLPNAMPHSNVRQRKKSRRRFDVALGLPGAEVRLPGLPHIAIGWRVVSFILVGLFAFLLYQLWNAPAFRIDSVKVSGLKRLNNSEVNAALGLAGQPIFFLDPDQIKQELLQVFPEFSEAQVQVSLPNNISIQVVERVPVITWTQNGQPYLIDEQGYAFTPRGDASAVIGPTIEAADSPPALPQPDQAQADALQQVAKSPLGAPQAVPTITAGAQAFLSPEMVSAVQEIASQAPEGAPLIYTSENGLGWRDPGGWDVFFGDTQEMPMKLIVYQSLIARLDDKEETLPAMVSVEYVHAPFYRPR